MGDWTMLDDGAGALPTAVLLAAVLSAAVALLALARASARRRAIERRDSALLARFEGQLAALVAASETTPGLDLLSSARGLMRREIIRHVLQDPSLDHETRTRFAETLGRLMEIRLQAAARGRAEPPRARRERTGSG